MRSAESIESISARVVGVGVGVGADEDWGVADGADEGEGDALAGGWANRFMTALQAETTKTKSETRRDISGPRSYRPRRSG
ncbi:MAG TPA: hypothetical protein VIM09_03975, partial [Chthoniobacterales bacterium]